MRTFFRIVTTLLALVLVVVIAAVLVATLYFDPNDFKDELADSVHKHTGRTMEISGNIELSFFPWLGIDVGRLDLGNAPGFADPVSKKRLKSTTQFDSTGISGRRMNANTWPMVAFGKLSFTP